MLNRIPVYCLLLFILVVHSCSKDENIGLNFNVQKLAVVVNQDMQNYNLLKSFNDQNEWKLIPNFIHCEWIDTSFLDGTPMIKLIDFGTGFLCSDGVTRKGKCCIEYYDYPGNSSDTMSLYANPSDSFAVKTQWGWSYNTGTIRIIKKSILQDTVISNWQISNSHFGDDFYAQLNSNVSRNLAKVLTISVNDEYIFNGSQSISSAQTGIMKSNGLALKKFANSNCLFAEGKLNYLNTENNIVIDFNPLKDYRVDVVAKAIQKDKEWFFDFQ